MLLVSTVSAPASATQLVLLAFVQEFVISMIKLFPPEVRLTPAESFAVTVTVTEVLISNEVVPNQSYLLNLPVPLIVLWVVEIKPTRFRLF